MFKRLVFLILCPLAIALLFQEFPPEFYLARPLHIESPEILAVGQCLRDDKQLKLAQTQFNEALGITPSTLTWKNITEIRRQVGKKLNDTNAFLTACQARTKFYQYLGAKYSSCTSPYRLLTFLNPGDNVYAPFEYSDFWSEMDFDCNAGLQIAVNDWYSLTSLKVHNVVVNCTQIFRNQTLSDHGHFCGHLNGYLDCLSFHYLNVTYNSLTHSGDKVGSWFWCEEARVAFRDDCPYTRCYVGSGTKPSSGFFNVDISSIGLDM